MTDNDLTFADARILPYLYVSDWEAARTFYAVRLGLGWQAVSSDWVMVRGQAGSVCALISEGKRYETAPPHRAGVFLMVPDRLEVRVSALVDQGVALVRPVRRFTHGAEAAIADPDGNVIVLYETTLPGA
jgi:predicted enzyme related to lactoylglutathione lyase